MKIITSYIIIGSLLLAACRASHQKNKITMTGDYMETNFPLYNGIQIDELQVDSLAKDNTPYEFYSKETFFLRRKPGTSAYLIKNTILFNRPNGNWYWQNDSTFGLYGISIKEYSYMGYISKRDRFDHSYQKQYEIYTVEFKPGTWFMIDFRPDKVGENHHEFMYVDKDKKFTFYKLKEVGESN